MTSWLCGWCDLPGERAYNRSYCVTCRALYRRIAKKYGWNIRTRRTAQYFAEHQNHHPTLSERNFVYNNLQGPDRPLPRGRKPGYRPYPESVTCQWCGRMNERFYPGQRVRCVPCHRLAVRAMKKFGSLWGYRLARYHAERHNWEWTGFTRQNKKGQPT